LYQLFKWAASLWLIIYATFILNKWTKSTFSFRLTIGTATITRSHKVAIILVINKNSVSGWRREAVHDYALRDFNPDFKPTLLVRAAARVRAFVYVQTVMCARYTRTVPRWTTWICPGSNGPHSKSQGLSLEPIRTSETSPLFSPCTSPSQLLSLVRLIASFLVLDCECAQKSAYDLANHSEYPPLYNTLDRRATASDPRKKKTMNEISLKWPSLCEIISMQAPIAWIQLHFQYFG